MSYLGIVVSSVFASNALLSYGFGSVPDGKREGKECFASALALAMVNALASGLLWSIRGLLLIPLGLASLDLLFFALIAVPLLKFLSRVSALSDPSGSSLLAKSGSRADDLVVGSLVFGIALVSARSGYSLPEALAASAASGLGYWLALSLLGTLRERLELSDLPAPFKGGPAMLISAGLMALAFMGLDASFAKNLAG
jgi:Na+-translocating ferredoxin:NAD+ oxidoreductase subunit A